MASKSNLSKVFENATRNLSDTILYDWGIGVNKNPELPSNKPGAKEIKKKTKLEKLKEAIGEAGSEPEAMYKAFKDQYDMAMRAGQVSFAGSKFRLGVKEPKMAGGSTFTSIKEAKASDYRAKHKERMKKFLIERAYTAKG
tara:strand:+ start:23 stop:445 length:423 start_codon:yes stop_codon:yes gene_type:complete